MEMIIDGKRTTLAEYKNRKDNRVIKTFDNTGPVVVVTTAPPTNHLPHVKRAKEKCSRL